MSNPRWVRSRGASIIAALVFAGILTAIAIAVQSTVPVTHVPAPVVGILEQTHPLPVAVNVSASQPAAVLLAAAEPTSCLDSTGKLSPGPCPSTTSAPSTAEIKAAECDGKASPDKNKYPCVPGFDYIVFIPKGTNEATTFYFPVCPVGSGNAIPAYSTFSHAGSTWGKAVTGTRCVYDNVLKKLQPKPGVKWMSRTIECGTNYTAASFSPIQVHLGTIRATVSTRTPNDASANCKDITDSTTGEVTGTPSTPDSTTVPGDPTLPPSTPVPTIGDPEGIKTIEDAYKAIDPIEDYLTNCKEYPKHADCSLEDQKIAQAELVKANEKIAEIAGRELLACAHSSGGCTEGREATLMAAERDAKERLDELKKEAVTVTPPGGCKPGECTTKTGPGTTGPGSGPGATGPGGQASGPGTSGPGTGGNPGTGGFGNPTLGGQQNQPSSPFGGPCTTRYVCQGQTLYYQTVQNYGGTTVQGQCMTQPVQQCQYGCMQTQSQTQQSSTGSMLQGISAGLQVFSSLSNLFGGNNGGGSTNTTAPNLPSQCAMTPQQGGQPSPYGNGTNGQPCTQPPQQPNPALCTSGQWKPTSGSNNGCTTGWQCVPTGGTTTNPDQGPPTAQLSCQPRIADVGMKVGFSFSCGNAAASTGTGFSTGGAVSGTSSSTIDTPPTGQNLATYTLTCINQGITASAQCQVEISKPSIIMVTNPQKVKSGETANIGWITTGMDSCVISSPDQSDFTQGNVELTNVNGTAETSPVTATANFKLSCQTLGGQTKTASTTVSISD